jgi:hypothetical protein
MLKFTSECIIDAQIVPEMARQTMIEAITRPCRS